MAEQITVKTQATGHTLAGQVWFIGWLFTIGFLKLKFMSAVIALIGWPWYLGRYFSHP